MNYATQVGNPTAHITKKKSRLKVYNGHIVFLNDKDNFEFEIHNPKQSSVLCKIKLNGQYISNSGVVVKPGQRLFLERFLDSNNKFEFSTYEVKNTSENRSAIDLNGDVIIEFYDEGSTSYYPHLSGGNWGNGWTTINTGSPYYGNMTFTTSGLNGTVTTNTSSYFSKSIETGRVEKGVESNQSFVNSYQNFVPHTCNRVQFKIIPLSTKNKNVEEIRQYCTECGTKVKKNYKFCPSCGNKI
jgi:hypothetical protein